MCDIYHLMTTELHLTGRKWLLKTAPIPGGLGELETSPLLDPVALSVASGPFLPITKKTKNDKNPHAPCQDAPFFENGVGDF